MIPLFSFPSFKIDSANYNHLLHGRIVTEFEEAIAEYVGAKYCVTFNSATSAILLALWKLEANITIPSIMTPVVANAIVNSGNGLQFRDSVEWVGSNYVLHSIGNQFIHDCAQRIHKGIYDHLRYSDRDLMIFSFYPTKPIAGIDGGAIVTNDKHVATKLRMLSMNGMSQEENSWERHPFYHGHKMYMSSMQADVAMQSLRRIGEKKAALAEIRQHYNQTLGLNNISDHLYRIKVDDNKKFIAQATETGIQCGIHYLPLHKFKLYHTGQSLPLSEETGRTMVSIPFHDELNNNDLNKITDFVCRYQDSNPL